MNIIVGENNAGKTNIFRALNYLKGFISKKTEFKDFDWYKGVTEKGIEIKVTFQLNYEDTSHLARLLIKDTDGFRNKEEKMEALKRDLFKNIQIVLSYLKGVPISEVFYFKCGFLYVRYTQGDLRLQKLSSYHPIRWKDLLNEYFNEENHKSLLKLLQDKYNERENEKQTFNP